MIEFKDLKDNEIYWYSELELSFKSGRANVMVNRFFKVKAKEITTTEFTIYEVEKEKSSSKGSKFKEFTINDPSVFAYASVYNYQKFQRLYLTKEDAIEERNCYIMDLIDMVNSYYTVNKKKLESLIEK